VDDTTGEVDYVDYTWPDENGEERSNRCCKNSCPVCVVINAQRVAGAIQLADPPWWFSLTLVGDYSHQIVRNVSRVIHYARVEIPTFEDVWAAEENPAHTGVHIHGYLHAGRSDNEIDEDVFQDVFEGAVRRVGIGHHWKVGPINNPQPGFFGYPMKSVVGEDYEVERF